MLSLRMHALCAYSTFRHHPHSLGYPCAKFRFCHAPHYWASPRKIIGYAITHSLTHPAYLLCQEPKLIASEKVSRSIMVSKLNFLTPLKNLGNVWVECLTEFISVSHNIWTNSTGSAQWTLQSTSKKNGRKQRKNITAKYYSGLNTRKFGMWLPHGLRTMWLFVARHATVSLLSVLLLVWE